MVRIWDNIKFSQQLKTEGDSFFADVRFHLKWFDSIDRDIRFPDLLTINGTNSKMDLGLS